MVEREALDLVEGDKDTGEEGLVLLFKRKGKTIDD